MMQQILESQGSKYYDESPTGTKEYLYLWAALNKFGGARYPDWTGREVFLQDTYASYNREQKKVTRWCRHEIWQELQRLKRLRPESSWRDILEHKRGLSQEDTKNYDYSQLAKIVEDWERFDNAKIELQSAFGDGCLQAYFLEGNGSRYLLKNEFWKATHTWEAFENSDSDFFERYKQHFVYRAFLERNSFHHSDSTREMRGTICVKKHDLEKFLSGHKEEPPQPSSLEINAETIIKFLETKGYVNPHFKLMLHYVCKGITESSLQRDFENWVKSNGHSLVPEFSKSQIDTLKDSRYEEMFRQIKK